MARKSENVGLFELICQSEMLLPLRSAVSCVRLAQTSSSFIDSDNGVVVS